MYWTGERVHKITGIIGWPPNQAHNGYIETYLNLGAIGLCILCGWIVVAFRKTRIALIKDFHLGQFQLAFLLVILAYNYTEAAFKALHPIWTMFFLVSIGCESYRWRRLSRAKAVVPRERPVVYTEAGWGQPAGRSGATV
jgi:O-antigen ligase